MTIREFVERALGLITRFKSKDELLEEEFDKFITDHAPSPADVTAVKTYFKAYVTSEHVRRLIDTGQLAPALATNPGFSINDYRAVPPTHQYRTGQPCHQPRPTTASTSWTTSP